MERSTYKRRCLQDHLLDTSTYKQLTKQEAELATTSAEKGMKLLIEEFKNKLPEHELTFFNRVFQIERRIPQFYTTPKVHKKPWKTRPIVSCVNSTLGYLSKWADRQLQKVTHLCPGYLKDSQALLDKLKTIGKLPSTAVLIVADAVGMYTNIDTNHGIQALKEWLSRHNNELPKGFPTTMVLRAVELVMKNNIFQFDNTFWHQLTGTAMGTPVACTYATIYFANHEETTFLPKFQLLPTPTPTPAHNSPLLLYGRLIDDTCQIWDLAKLPDDIPIYLQTK